MPAPSWHRDFRVEHGSWPHVLQSSDVALIAHYSESPAVSRSLDAQLASLAAAGFATVVISTSPVSSALKFREQTPTMVVRRSNVAYDFGSWAWAIGAAPELANRRVLLTNDSLAGPFESAEPWYRRFQGSQTDIWGLIGSGQFQWHLQSYCVGYAPGVLGDPQVRQFWRSVEPKQSKIEVILTYELGQTRMLREEGFTIDVEIPPGLIIDRELNPAILAWKRVLDLGIPFVKKELVRDPAVAPDGAEVPAELRRRYGVEVEDWL